MKIAIYTALTGGYDNLIQPRCTDSDFTFICFSNDIKEKQVGVWKIKDIPNVTEDIQRLSRYPKMHPHTLLNEFDYSVYIDANVEIRDDTLYRNVKNLIGREVILAGVKHHEVDCAYAEGLRIIISKKEKNVKAVINMLRFLRREKFPYHFGMYEANVIFRNHHNHSVIEQCETWWKIFMAYVKRDQLSYSYSLWKYKIPFDFILSEEYNTRNHYGLFAGTHGKESLQYKKVLKRWLFVPALWILKRYVGLTKYCSK